MNLFRNFLPPERETNLRRILAELDAAKRQADRMLAEIPKRDTNARERIGDEQC